MFWRRRKQPAQSSPPTDIARDQVPTNPSPTQPPLGSQSRAGYLGHYDLTDWWDATFNTDERQFLEAYLQPLLHSGNWRSGRPPTSRSAGGREATASKWLTTLAGFLKRKDRAELAIRLLDRARSYQPLHPLDEHFALMAYIEVRYKQRDQDPVAINDVIHACERMITIVPEVKKAFRDEHDQGEALMRHIEGAGYRADPFPGIPNHPAFDRLRIIYKKQGNHKEATRVQRLYETIWEPYTIDHRHAKAEERKAKRAAAKAAKG